MEQSLPPAIERDVSATRGEYLRALQLAFPDGLAHDGDRIVVAAGGAALEIGITELPPRTIALLRLARLKVTLRFLRGDPGAQSALLSHMDLAMQRGGG